MTSLGIVLTFAAAICTAVPAFYLFSYTLIPGAFGIADEIRSDFDADGYDDLAIAVPFEDFGSVSDAGAGCSKSTVACQT